MNQGNEENISPQLKREVFGDYTPITPIIYLALETAHSVIPESLDTIIAKSKVEYDESDLKRINLFLRPTLIRSVTQLILRSKNVNTLAVADEQAHSLLEENWERIILSNNGLAGSYAQRKYKILKGIKSNIIEGIMPPPGPSKKKGEWYCNSHLAQAPMKLFEDDPTPIQKHNAMYIWLDSKSGISLYLGCPKWGLGNKVIAYFVEPVPHPIEQMPQLPRVEEIVEELNIEKLREDLDKLINLGYEQDEEIKEGGESNESEQDNLRSSN